MHFSILFSGTWAFASPGFVQRFENYEAQGIHVMRGWQVDRLEACVAVIGRAEKILPGVDPRFADHVVLQFIETDVSPESVLGGSLYHPEKGDRTHLKFDDLKADIEKGLPFHTYFIKDIFSDYERSVDVLLFQQTMVIRDRGRPGVLKGLPAQTPYVCVFSDLKM